ncbi:transcriptional regulator [uncultured Rheinheimera sp.]|jgi:transcriptional regulator with XRE-family HTH domain|uniref:transcriptional regulator n=1 Tax=uncultured Rheinheimera sp. TaxID=400532 RepID=UPI000025FD35|nr:transcriptional regulator [uncultured Rheinheimera sp.]
MKVPVKSVADIGQVIRITRISQDLDQLTAAQLSNAGQSFLSHLENGKETAQIGKVLQVLESLGIGVELTLPPDIEALLAKQNKSEKNNINSVFSSPYVQSGEPSLISRKFFVSEVDEKSCRKSPKTSLEVWEKILNSKRVRRS